MYMPERIADEFIKLLLLFQLLIFGIFEENRTMRVSPFGPTICVVAVISDDFEGFLNYIMPFFYLYFLFFYYIYIFMHGFI